MLSARFYESIGVDRWPGGADRWVLRIDQCWVLPSFSPLRPLGKMKIPASLTVKSN